MDPWAGVGYDPTDPLASMRVMASAPRPDAGRLARVAVAARQCGARFDCGCNSGHRCRVREMAFVSLEDCARCLSSRGLVGNGGDS